MKNKIQKLFLLLLCIPDFLFAQNKVNPPIGNPAWNRDVDIAFLFVVCLLFGIVLYYSALSIHRLAKDRFEKE